MSENTVSKFYDAKRNAEIYLLPIEHIGMALETLGLHDASMAISSACDKIQRALETMGTAYGDSISDGARAAQKTSGALLSAIVGGAFVTKPPAEELAEPPKEPT